MFTLLRDGDQTQVDTLLEVVLVADPQDPVYVFGRGWMTVGDLRWDMNTTAGDGPRSAAANGRAWKP